MVSRRRGLRRMSCRASWSMTRRTLGAATRAPMTILSCRERRPDLRALRLPLGAPAPGRLPPWGMMGILSRGAKALRHIGKGLAGAARGVNDSANRREL